MNENLDIFICAHKDFDNCPNNNIYKICSGENDLKNEYLIDVIHEKENMYTPIRYSLSNMSRIYYIWKNYSLKNYIGFVQYNRHFDYTIINENLDIDDDTCIVPERYNLPTNVIIQFANSHNNKDYILCRELIKYKFNYSEQDISKTENILYAHNIFIMTTKRFNDYCNFIFTILDAFISINNLKTMDDINTKYYGSQNRILGYLSERIGNIYIQHTFNNIIEKHINKQ